VTARRVTARRILVVGALVGLIYVAALAVTLAVSGRHVRPLYDGFGPPPAYRWVNPPAVFASGNVRPHPVSIDFALTGGVSDAVTVGTTDAQFAVYLSRGAVAPHPPDTKVTGAVTPLDPATLPALPSGLRPDGNAYRIELHYSPSGAAVTQLAQTGNVIVTIPESGHALLFSPDGQVWQAVAARPVGGGGVLGGVFSAPGYYVAGTNTPAPTSGRKGSGSSSPGLVAGAAAALALASFFVPWVFRRRRSGRAGRSGSQSRSGRRRPSRR